MQQPSRSSDTFEYFALRFDFEAQGRFSFPTPAANVFRGALGLSLRQVAFHTYGTLFARQRREEGPSGLRAPAAGFVFRSRELDGKSFDCGERFGVGVHLFTDGREIPQIQSAFAYLARNGFGPERSRARLLPCDTAVRQSLSLVRPEERIYSLKIHFLTATELKSCNGAEFEGVACRARDRISTLRALYGPGPLDIDFVSFRERARAIRMTHNDTRHVVQSRRSSRTGQTHELSGFVGSAIYEGELTGFVPYLRAAAVTGIGRHTVWGNGEITLEVCDGLQ